MHKVDVQEPVLQPRAFDLDMLGELVVALKSARGNAPMVRPRNRAQTSILSQDGAVSLEHYRSSDPAVPRYCAVNYFGMLSHVMTGRFTDAPYLHLNHQHRINREKSDASQL